MTEVDWQDDDGVSVFWVGTTLLRNRWRIARWMFIGAMLALLAVYNKPALYVATASFSPQGNAPASSSLANLATQFGVSLPTGNGSLSPDFYAALLESRVLLDQIVRDTFVVQEMGNRRVAVLDLLKVPEGPAKLRQEQGVKLLGGIVTSSVSKLTGVVDVSVATKWPSVSLAITTALVNGVNDYNQRTRQGQAAAERKFVEGRLTVAAADLREAEDRLEAFQRTNRQIRDSPELVSEGERIQRVVMSRQQVFTSLTQAYEDARIREVRDTPVITMFEPPSVPSLPQPRGRLKTVILGFLLGGFFAGLLAFGSEVMSARRGDGNADVDEFVAMLREMRGELLKPFRRRKARIQR